MKRGEWLLILLVLLPVTQAKVLTLNASTIGFVSAEDLNCFLPSGNCTTDYHCDATQSTVLSKTTNSFLIPSGGANVTDTDVRFMRGFAQFDTALLPKDAEVSHVALKLFITQSNMQTFSVKSIDPDVAVKSAAILYNEINQSATWYQGSGISAQQMLVIDLGQSAIAKVQGFPSLLALGFTTDENICQDGDFNTPSILEFSSAELIISYVNNTFQDYYPTKDCPGVNICGMNIYCGVGDGLCPATYAVQLQGYSSFQCGAQGSVCCDPDCGSCGSPPANSKGGLIPPRFSQNLPFYLQSPTDYNPLFWQQQNAYDAILIPDDCLSLLKAGESCNQTWMVSATSSASIGNYPFFADYNSSTSTISRPGLPLSYVNNHISTPLVDVSVLS